MPVPDLPLRLHYLFPLSSLRKLGIGRSGWYAKAPRLYARALHLGVSGVSPITLTIEVRGPSAEGRIGSGDRTIYHRLTLRQSLCMLQDRLTLLRAECEELP